jgi:uncharacterized protein
MKSSEKSGNEDAPVKVDDVDENAFAEYLRQHPDFFQRHTAVLSRLIIPHPGSGRAISLLERQVLALRDEQEQERHKLRELIRNAKENDRLARRMEELALYLMSPQSLDERLDDLPRKVRKIFDLEYVALHRHDEAGADCIKVDLVDALCTTRLGDDERQWLFGVDAAEIASCALVPLKLGRQAQWFAVLAIGSSDRNRYHADSGTHYLKQLQRLLGASVTQLHALTAR